MTAATLVITGGGTGGHLTAATALRDACVEGGAIPVFIGTTSGRDRQWLAEERGFAATHFLPSTAIAGQPLRRRLGAIRRLGAAATAASRLLREHRAAAVVSVGAYAAAPASLAALTTETPLFLHEHNVVMGTLHRCMRPWARAVFGAFAGNDFPVGADFFSRWRPRSKVERVLFLGGSRGARFINDFALRAAPRLREMGLEVAHQTGHEDLERVRADYRARGVEVDVFAFDPDLASRMADADFAIARAGAATLWELAANGLPALFIPYPHAVRDHQYKNARYLADRGLATVARQEQVDVELLLAALRADLTATSAGLAALVRPGGAGRTVDEILRHLAP